MVYERNYLRIKMNEWDIFLMNFFTWSVLIHVLNEKSFQVFEEFQRDGNEYALF